MLGQLDMSSEYMVHSTSEPAAYADLENKSVFSTYIMAKAKFGRMWNLLCVVLLHEFHSGQKGT